MRVGGGADETQRPARSASEPRAELERRYAEAESRFPGEVPLPPHWGGYRLVPDAYEFWQHGDDRLHDRIRYDRAADGWSRVRLAP